MKPEGGTPLKPLPRFRRSGEAPRCLLQDRDFALLEDLWRFRCLTTSQMELLRGCDPEEDNRFVSRLTLTRRLKLLYHGRFIQRLARPATVGTLEPVYVLDSEGARALSRSHGEVTFRAPSQLPKLAKLEHQLAINQMRVSLLHACYRTQGKDNELRLFDWKGSEEARFVVSVAGPKNATRKVTLLPDGMFVLKTPAMRLHCFVEADLGTEVSRIIADKCRAYYTFWQSGGFARQYEVPAKVGFRVLFVAPSEKRAATILSSIAKLDAGKSMFWVAREEGVHPERILRPIWRDAVHEDRRYDLTGQPTPLKR